MSQCLNSAPVPVCAVDADGVKQSLLEHVVYENGVAIGQVFTTADDTETPIDVAGLTISPGACQIPQPNITFDRLCDVQADGSSIPFFCERTVNYGPDCLPLPPTTIFYELDKVTVYVPTGESQLECPDCIPVGSLGTITDWSVLAG